MLETILNDVLQTMRATFLGGDLVAIAIAVGSVAVAALMMRRSTQIGSMTLLALTLFAIGGYLRGVIAGPAGEEAAVTGGRLAGQLQSSWGLFMNMTAASLLSYFLAFMLLIIVVFGAKSVFSRG